MTRRIDPPNYRLWASMIQRCTNPNDDGYANYGGRGIRVCKRWLTFANFAADMGPRPAGMSLDRMDVNGNYEPTNCRWATKAEQEANKRTNRNFTFRGETHNINEWARIAGIDVRTFHHRIKTGWTIQQAVETPVTKDRKGIQRGRRITFNGVTDCCIGWDGRLGFKPGAVAARLVLGWTEIEAVSVQKGERRHV